MTIILGYLIIVMCAIFVGLVIWESVSPSSTNRHGILARRKPHTRAVLALLAILLGLVSLVLLTNVGAST